MDLYTIWADKEGDKSYYSYFNEEVYRVAIPNTLRIQQQHPDINHRSLSQRILRSMEQCPCYFEFNDCRL